MAQPPAEKKFDLSSLPRGAIGIKGQLVSRNTRLPSIRSPRDLTLGAPPKRTYTPNIPPRREKKPSKHETPSTTPQVPSSLKPTIPVSEHGWGRGKGRAQIIQTEGAVFSEGIAQSSMSRKEKTRDAYQKTSGGSTRGSSSLKNDRDDVQNLSKNMDNLFRDDFIDDGDEFEDITKPIIFPMAVEVKEEEVKNETQQSFNENIAKDVGYDITKVAKFIKKEKESESEAEKKLDVSKLPPSKLTDLLSQDGPELLLLQFPKCATLPLKLDDSQSETTNEQSDADTRVCKGSSGTSIASLPDGFAGKLQVLKSGKARLVLGSLTFDLDSFNMLQSKHEVASLRTNSGTGNLALLGSVKHKLKFAPNVDILLA